MKHDLLINYVQAASLTRFSEPFPMNGGNTASVQLVGLVGSLTSVDVQESHDLENWTTLTPTVTVWGSAPAAQIRAIFGIGAEYCRLKIVSGVSRACFNAHVNTATT